LDYLIAGAEAINENGQDDPDPDHDTTEHLPDPDVDPEQLPPSPHPPASKPAVYSRSNPKTNPRPKKKSTTTEDKDGDTIRKINPNAISHMNFKTLKIRNKNSKAKGGRRFGKGRR
jgi:hypothetical protein